MFGYRKTPAKYHTAPQDIVFMLRDKTDYIVVHCSATEPGLRVGVGEIRQWHLDQGWNDIGYHFVITRAGAVQHGRPLAQVGAHVRGHNHNSVGICLVGGVDSDNNPEQNYTFKQYLALRLLIDGLKVMYQGAKLMGHRDFPEVSKDCPCFDVRDWYKHE